MLTTLIVAMLAAGLISSGKPGRHREANRYTALLDRITAETRRAKVDQPPM